jgi:hypothetical protein
MTANLIATANTLNGFAIGVVARTSDYTVVRMNRDSHYIVLSAHSTEAAARTAANTEWKLDMGR